MSLKAIFDVVFEEEHLPIGGWGRGLKGACPLQIGIYPIIYIVFVCV